MEKYRETKTTADWNGMIHKLCENRLYMGILLLTAVCAYGYKVTNVTIGIDDTPSLYYFEEGLIAIVGRWVLFLLNKVITLAEFVPFVTDFAAVQTFFKITIPQLKPIVLLTTIMSTNGTLQLFDETMNITQGGPANATITVSHYIYNQSFVYAPNFGYASAISYMVVFIMIILAIIQFTVAGKED